MLVSIKGKNSIGAEVLLIFGTPVPTTPDMFEYGNPLVGMHCPTSEVTVVSAAERLKRCDKSGKAEVMANKIGNPAK